MANKFTRPSNPPPRLFFGEKERDLVKQINDELIEGIIGQQILYYPISIEHTNYHPLYGEAINKTFLNPVRVFALVEWHGHTTTSEDGYTDRTSTITIHFHKRRLTEDQDLFVQEGDFVQYGDQHYEIVELSEPREIFGNTSYKIEISAKCIKSRDAMFNAR